MKKLERITFDPAVMGGRPCIRGLRVTVGTLVGLLAAGKSRDDILRLYPFLEEPREGHAGVEHQLACHQRASRWPRASASACPAVRVVRLR